MLEVDAPSDGGFPESASSDLGCPEPSLSYSFTPASAILNRSASFSLAGSTGVHTSDANVHWHVEMLGTYLYNAARATDKKAIFLEKIVSLVNRGDLEVNPNFRVPEVPVLALPDPSPRPVKPTGTTLFMHNSIAFMYHASSTDPIVISSSESTRLECVSSKLYTLMGRARLAASGGPLELASSSSLLTHSLKPTGPAHLAVLSLQPARAPQPFAIALPLAASRLDLATSTWSISPAFTGSLIFPLSFALATPVTLRLQLLRDALPESDSQSGSQGLHSPGSRHTNISDTSAPTVVQLHPHAKHVVHVSPDIEGVAILRSIDNSVLLFIVPGAHHYAGQHMRLPRIVTVQVPSQPESTSGKVVPRRRPTKRSTTEVAASSTSGSTAPANLSLVEQIQQAVLANDDRLFSSLLCSAPSATEVLLARNRFGETVLHLAAAAGNTHMVNLCCSHGADPLARDYSGLTALQVAEQQHNNNARAVLHIMQDKTAIASVYAPKSAGPAPEVEVFLRPKDLSSASHVTAALKPVRAPLKTLGTVNVANNSTATVAPPHSGHVNRRATGAAQISHSTAPSFIAPGANAVTEPVSHLKRKQESVIAVFMEPDTGKSKSAPTQLAKKPTTRTSKRITASSMRTSNTSRAALTPAEPETAVHWLELPPQLLVYIITLVSYNDVASITRTCRVLKHLASPWRVKELRIRPEVSWPSQEISAKMREILIDWLIDVQQEYKLHRNTLFLAVSYIDRVLCCTNLSKRDLQLLGATCMWIASKYEELMAPSLRDFEYICDTTYPSTEFADMESRVLRKLNFELAGVTMVHFATEYLAELAITRIDLVQLVYFFTELALADHSLAVSTPSCVTTAILMLVTAHFLPEAECLASQSRLRAISGYQGMDPEVRKSMQRLAAFFPRGAMGTIRAQPIFDKYAKEEPFVSLMASRVSYNV